MPEGPFYYPETDVTDRSERFLAAEIIREKILLFLQEEIPHGVQVLIEEYADGENLCDIHAVIVCEKASHKSIIIGKNGAMLKKIGIAARTPLEKLTGKQVNLKTFVKVVEDWRDNPAKMKGLGFNN
jgi:GTP-binding protein Era